MKKYEVTYKNAKASYTAEKLDAVAAYKSRIILRDGDYLAVAIELFCDTHFMWKGATRCDSVDARTRGDKSQSWIYQPNGVFEGWIYAGTQEQKERKND